MSKKTKNSYKKITNSKLISKIWGIKSWLLIKSKSNFPKNYNKQTNPIQIIHSKSPNCKKNSQKNTNNSQKKKNWLKFGVKNTQMPNKSLKKSLKILSDTKTKPENLRISTLNWILLSDRRSKKMPKCCLKLSTSKWRLKSWNQR